MLQNSIISHARIETDKLDIKLKWNPSFRRWSFILLLTVKAQLPVHVFGLGDKKQGH